MHAWEAIDKTLSYIEENIGEEMYIDQLAALAALSPFYYQRLFSRLVKKPVREYIKLRRLAHAAECLREKEKRIVDVALELGFGSHESFTRAFKAAYGMTPEAYRAAPVQLNCFDKPDLLLEYILVDEGVPLVSDGLVLEFNRRVQKEPVWFMGVEGIVQMESQVPVGEATGIDVPGQIWGRFHAEKEKIPRLLNGREVGTIYQGDAPAGAFTYFAGAEVAAQAEEPCFVRWQLQPGKYIVCGFEAEDFQTLTTVALNKAIKYCTFWLQEHGLLLTDAMTEIYYGSEPDATYMELWLPTKQIEA